MKNQLPRKWMFMPTAKEKNYSRESQHREQFNKSVEHEIIKSFNIIEPANTDREWNIYKYSPLIPYATLQESKIRFLKSSILWEMSSIKYHLFLITLLTLMNTRSKELHWLTNGFENQTTRLCAVLCVVFPLMNDLRIKGPWWFRFGNIDREF